MKSGLQASDQNNAKSSVTVSANELNGKKNELQRAQTAMQRAQMSRKPATRRTVTVPCKIAMQKRLTI
jgi:hypothetical protein